MVELLSFLLPPLSNHIKKFLLLSDLTLFSLHLFLRHIIMLNQILVKERRDSMKGLTNPSKTMTCPLRNMTRMSVMANSMSGEETFSIPYLTSTLGFSPQVALRSRPSPNPHQFLHPILKYETKSSRYALFLVDHAAFEDQASKTELGFRRVGGVFFVGFWVGVCTMVVLGFFLSLVVKRER